MNFEKERQTDGWKMDEWRDGIDGWMDWQMFGLMDGQMNRWRDGLLNRCLEGWTNE